MVCPVHGPEYMQLPRIHTASHTRSAEDWGEMARVPLASAALDAAPRSSELSCGDKGMTEPSRAGDSRIIGGNDRSLSGKSSTVSSSKEERLSRGIVSGIRA